MAKNFSSMMRLPRAPSAPLAARIPAVRRDRALRPFQGHAQQFVRRAVCPVPGGPPGRAPVQFARRACHQGFTILTIIPDCAHALPRPATRKVRARFFSGPTYGVMPACK